MKTRNVIVMTALFLITCASMNLFAQSSDKNDNKKELKLSDAEQEAFENIAEGFAHHITNTVFDDMFQQGSYVEREMRLIEAAAEFEEIAGGNGVYLFSARPHSIEGQYTYSINAFKMNGDQPANLIEFTLDNNEGIIRKVEDKLEIENAEFSRIANDFAQRIADLIVEKKGSENLLSTLKSEAECFESEVGNEKLNFIVDRSYDWETDKHLDDQYSAVVTKVVGGPETAITIGNAMAMKIEMKEFDIDLDGNKAEYKTVLKDNKPFKKYKELKN